MDPLRAIVLRFTNDSAHAALERVMAQRPFAFCASVGFVRRTYAVHADAQPWFPSSAVRSCLYDGVDFNTLLPLDEALIESMRGHEAVFMRLVTRLEYARTIPYDERKRMYFMHLRFWNDFLERQRITLFLSGILPHEIPDYLIYGLCRLKKIPTLILHASTIPDCAFLTEDIEASAVHVRDRYQELLADPPSAVRLSAIFEEYFARQTQSVGKQPITFRRPTALDRILDAVRRRTIRSFIAFVRWLSTLFSWRAWRRRAQKVSSARERARLARVYDALAVDPDFTHPYVYAPLQFQPECSTLPMAGAYVDQAMTMQLLSQCLPAGVLLYVKEHPRQRTKGTACRSASFYRSLAALPNVRLIRHDTSSFALREHCRAVATGTGTAGFEAIFRGKPTLLFGHCFYQYAPGVYPIRTAADCRNAIDSIFQRGEHPAPKHVRLYLRAMEETCVRASVNEWHRAQASHTSFEENTAAIASALQQRIMTLYRVTNPL